MKEQIMDFINAIEQGDALGAESLINNVLASKVGDAIEARRVEVGATMFSTPSETETE